MRNKEAISSIRNRIAKLKVFPVLLIDGRVFFRIFALFIVFKSLFLNRLSTRV